MPVREITVEVYAPTEAELDAIECAASSAYSRLALRASVVTPAVRHVKATRLCPLPHA
jgi:hypothetical protein